MQFFNKAVLVTGASAGIGAAIAIAFAKQGADVVLVGRNETRLKSVEKTCQNKHNRVYIIKADISNDEEAKEMIREAVDKLGKLDILVNNAGTSAFGCLLDGKLLESFDRVMKLNLRAHIHVTSLATPFLVESKGNVINISSVCGSSVPPKPQYASYYISKAALDHFTRCSASELAKHGVRVNSVSPGPVNTNLVASLENHSSDDVLRTALNVISECEEIADLVLFLASAKAKSVTGANYVIDNGCLLINQNK